MLGALEEYENRKDKSPPFQPVLYSKTQNFDTRVLKWHPVGVKKDVLFYQFQADTDKTACTVELLPDACINILFECDPDNPRAMLSGFLQRPQAVQLKPGMTYFGFKPYTGSGFAFGELDLAELGDESVDLIQLLPDTEGLLHQLSEAQSFDEQIRLFSEYAKKQMIDQNYEPGFIDYFAMLLCTFRGTADLHDIQKSTGYSMRYCRERFREMHGISPKKYNNIMRFQSTLKQLMNSGDTKMTLTSLAANNGYFDQAHFIHDFQHFTNTTPSEFRRENMK